MADIWLLSQSRVVHRAALGYPRALECGLWPALWRCSTWHCVCLQEALEVLIMGGIGKLVS